MNSVESIARKLEESKQVHCPTSADSMDIRRSLSSYLEQLIKRKSLSFSEALRQAGLEYDLVVDTIAEAAQVSREVLDAMMAGLPVAPIEARSVLAILSQYSVKPYTMETVDIPLLSGEMGGKLP